MNEFKEFVFKTIFSSFVNSVFFTISGSILLYQYKNKNQNNEIHEMKYFNLNNKTPLFTEDKPYDYSNNRYFSSFG